MAGQLGLNVIVANVRPFIFVENNQVKTSVSNLRVLMDYIPKNINYTFKSINGYHIGRMNSTGHYSGLIGFLQRGEADLVYHPIPMLNNLPGFFTSPVFESGSKILSLVKYPKKMHADLTGTFLTFDTSVIVLFLLINLVLILMQPFIFNFKINFFQSNFLLYRLAFSECNLRSNQVKMNSVFFTILVYFFLIMSIVEQNNNSKLVVSEQVEYYDSINDIYRLRYVTPHLLKNNYVTDYFRFNYNDVKKREIFNRAEKCGCFHEVSDLLSVCVRERKILSTLNSKSVFIFEDRITKIAKRAICYGNFSWLTNYGILHLSSYVYKTLSAVLYGNKWPTKNRQELNRRFMSSFEQGISLKLKQGIAHGNFFGDSSDPLFHVCLENNDMNNVDRYSSITLINLRTINLVLLAVYALIFLIALVDFKSRN